jgi:predicted PurR-regulated permease PerM
MNSNWDLDRKPTTAERVVGVISSLLLCAASGVAFWFSLTFLKSFWASLVTGGFALFAAYLLYHFLFTSGRKPPRSQIIGSATVFTIVGLATLIGSFFAPNLRDKVMLLSLGLGGIGGGILNFSKMKKAPNQPAQPTRGKAPRG